jgi:dihydroorotate dehydrogenase electron transfer subunit
MFSEKLRVTGHVECRPAWYKIAFQLSEPAEEIVPGQFFMVGVGSGTDPFLRRPMSLHRLVRDEEGNPSGFELLYKVVGRGTELLSKVRVGETLDVLGPLGHGFWIAKGASQHCIVTGGTGVAPMPALTEMMSVSGIQPVVFYGARTGSELVCTEDFKEYDADLRLFTDDGSLGVKGLVTDELEELLSSGSEREKGESGTALYACGPHAMLAIVARLAQRADVPCQVSLESRMGCGLGACMSCAVRAAETGPDGEPRYLRVCLQGPVVDSRRVLWETGT